VRVSNECFERERELVVDWGGGGGGGSNVKCFNL